MLKRNREIQDLLIDYAGALRDGLVPTFLKSLTRHEAQIAGSSPVFWDATEVVRVLNNFAFADKATTPNVNLFISHIDAKIGSRLKKVRAPSGDRTFAAVKCVNEQSRKSDTASP